MVLKRQSSQLYEDLTLIKERLKKLFRKKINFPVVLKPINEGSSLGVEICQNEKNYF